MRSILIPATWQVKPLGRFSHGNKKVVLGVMETFDKQRRIPIIDTYRAVESYNETHEPKVRVVRPRVADSVLSDIEHDNWMRFLTCFRFPVDCALAYEMPGRNFEEFVVAEHKESGRRLLLPTGQYRGEKNIALQIRGLRYSDFQYPDGREVYLNVPEDRVVPITDLPVMGGWYKLGRKRIVPSADEADYSNGRKFTRKKEANVAAITRDACHSRLAIHTDGSFFDSIWTIVEIIGKHLTQGVGVVDRLTEQTLE
ncbi:MAG: hypothetical protein PHF60_02470 [Candidatus ainarchaeum sp.]|nr:hypothetical protein [Candidatus ainarchaeum sp.]